MKKSLQNLSLSFVLVAFSAMTATAQVMTQTFSSIPATWTQSNSCNSTSTNASWKLTTSNPGYGASGKTDNTGTTGSYAMWVDGSSPYPCDVSITTDSIDPSTLTSPSLEFYWFKNNTSTAVGNSTLTVELFDGQSYQAVWSGSTDDASWRKVQVDMSCISMPNDIALRFTVSKFNGSASFYNDIVVDDIKVQELPTGFSNCAAPTSIAVGTVTGGSATATVSEGCNSSATTTVIYGLAGFNPSTSGMSVTVSSGAASLTSLASSSSYEAYAVTSCGTSSYSDTLGPVSFITPCAIVATPWTDNLDAVSSGGSTNPSLPVCWDYYQGVSNYSIYATYHYTYGFISNSASNSLRTYRSSSTLYSGDTAMSLTPEIQGLDSATKQLEFYGRKGYSLYPGEILIGVTNAAGDASSLTIVDTVYMNSDVFEKYIVYLDAASGIASGDARVAFVTICNGTYDYMYMDDITVKDIPPCPDPLAISLTSATRSDATLSWSSSASAFDIEVGPTGFQQGTGDMYTSTSTSATAINLMMNTYYDAYVRANCTSSNDGYSSYIGPFTFKTECGWFDEPWTEDFGDNTINGNTSNPNLPDCWSYYGTGSQYSYVSGGFYGNSATNSRYLFLRAYQSSFSTLYNLGDTSMAILPLTNGLSGGDLQLLFSARGYSGAGVGSQTDNIIVGTIDSTGDKSSMFIIDTVPMLGSSYQDYTVDLTNTPTDAHSIFMMAIAGANGTFTYGYNESYIDNIEVRQAPQCPEPFGFITSVPNDTSATIDWSDSSVVSNYFVEWGQPGFTQGTGATIDTVSISEWSSSSLTSSTTYEFYVQSECSALGINSPWFGPITITTPCSPTAKPLVEGFENLASTFGSAAAPNFADCWVQDRGVASSYVRGMSNTYGTIYGNGYMEFWGMATVSDTVAFSSPPIENLSTEGAEVTFYGYLNSASYLGELEVGVSDFSGSLSSARAATEIKLNTSWQEFSVYLDSNFLQPGDARVSFILPEGSGTYNDLRIDSVTIADLPSCGTYNHTIASITDSSADLSWDYFGNDCFTIEYGLAGFIQGTGVGSQSGTIDSNITSNYAMSGLNPNTSYDFYVENCCNPGTWEGPFTFSTECTGPLAAGTYTVGSTGNFASLDSVFSTLNVCGIAGAVTFELQSGTFVAGNSLGSVNGSSTANTITFTGASGASDTLVQISLSGASNVILDDLFIYNMSSDGVVLNETDNVTISNSTIQVTTTSTSTLAGMPIASRSGQYYYNGSSESNLTITNNELIGGYYGISLYGSSANRSSNVHVADNVFTQQYYYGCNLSYTDGVEFHRNTVSSPRNTNAYGVRFYYDEDVTAHDNHISGGNYGMYLFQTQGESELANNMLSTNAYGIYNYFGDSVSMYHNTATGNYALYNYFASNTDAVNNIFVGNTYAVYARLGSSNHFDNNVYFSNGTYMAYTTTLIDSLGEWQLLDSTMNHNSVEGDPVFKAPGDLHVVGLAANDAGDNTLGITHDIDGDLRPSLISTTVDIGADEFDVVYKDAALTAIVSPGPSGCGGDSVEVIVEVTNLGVTPMTSTDISVNFAGQSLSGTYPVDTIQLGESDDISLGYISQRVGGFYTLDAEVTLSGDSRAGNDLKSVTIEILDAQQVIPTVPTVACAGDLVSLAIAHPQDGLLMWSSNGDTLATVAADSTITLTLTQDTTLTLSAVASPDNTGNVRGLGTGGGNYTFMSPGLFFTVNQVAIIDSVTLYPNAAGSTTIDIQDASGTVVWTTSVTTSATGNTAEQVYLGANVQPGSYSMRASASTCGGLYREFGYNAYPLATGGNEVVITNGTLTNYHYFFYNWVVTVGGCERPDSTVTIMVHPDPVAAISVDDANATISATDWMANWSTAGTANADSIYVEFSNGTSSNDTSGTVTFTANNAGETVTVIAFGPCSSDTATFTFDVNQISVDEDFLNGTLSIYPNPTRGLFNVEFATASATNVEISIVNMVGQVISNEVVTVNGLYNNQFDLSDESAGVYFIKFTTDEGVLTERITVE